MSAVNYTIEMRNKEESQTREGFGEDIMYYKHSPTQTSVFGVVYSDTPCRNWRKPTVRLINESKETRNRWNLSPHGKG